MKLFEPIEVGGIPFKNRIYMASMVTVGLHSPKALAFYEARARGGVGAIATQYIIHWSWMLERAEELRPLTEAVHRIDPDCKIAVQPGAMVQPEGFDLPAGITSPSGFYSQPTIDALTEGLFEMPFTPTEMTKEEIRSTIDKLAESAVNLKRVGFDFLEIHGTHAYLFRQFFSPLDNRRTDEYGGSVENRMRFPLETVRAIREAAGKEFLIFYKLPAMEADFGGITLDESCRFARELEGAGVDALAVSVGVNSHPRGYRNSVVPFYHDFPHGTFVEYAAKVKQWVNIPVIALGRISRPEHAESILQEGKADMIGMGRQLIADPEWPHKVATGRWGSIRPCLSCNACMDHHFLVSHDDEDLMLASLRCSVNPYAALEDEIQITPASEKKKVLVIGGGPSGMEAAKTAASRGHQVTLCEEATSLGGMLVPGCRPPHKQDIERFRQYLTMELRRTGVEVVTQKRVTVEDVQSMAPDAVILAAGGVPPALKVPGADNANVVTAFDVLLDRVSTGTRAIVVGGGLVGLEIALLLEAQGKRVSVLDMLPEMGANLPPTTRCAMVQKVKESGILMEVNARVVEFNEQGVVVERGGSRESFSADTVVLALGLEARREIVDALKGAIEEVHVVGDCVAPRRILDAIHEGAKAGREV